MRGGAKLLAVAALGVAGCAANSGELQIRAVQGVAGAGQPVPAKIADGRAQLALGNAGLALELFRGALREQPSSVDAQVGMASSYDIMGRFDLSRRHYEAALARAPADTDILGRFARSLELQGRPEEAAAVKDEIRTRLAAAPAGLDDGRAIVALTPPDPAPPIAPIRAQRESEPEQPARLKRPASHAELPQMAAATITVSLPPVQASSIALANEPDPAPAQPLVTSEPAPPTLARPVSRTDLPQLAAGPLTLAPPLVEASAIAPLTAEEPARSVAPALASAKRSLPVISPWAQARGPRLERMSPAVVALVTSKRPQWQPRVISQSAQSTTVRFVPLKSARSAAPGLRLLNAARSEGLAARTRQYLLARGWRQIGIGNAASARASSVILYPESRRRTAEVLAAQFKLPIARRASGSDLVLLLGRDAARLKALQADS